MIGLGKMLGKIARIDLFGVLPPIFDGGLLRVHGAETGGISIFFRGPSLWARGATPAEHQLVENVANIVEHRGVAQIKQEHILWRDERTGAWGSGM